MRSIPDLNLHNHKVHGSQSQAHNLCQPVYTYELYNPVNKAVSCESLKNHTKIHHNDCILHCSFCAETFTYMRDLNIHTANNHGEYLSTNLALATTDEAHNCSLCGEPFVDNEAMKAHLAKHHELSSFHSCNICDSIFAQYDHLETHLKVAHDVAYPAPCPYCGQIFLNYGVLYNHTQNAHSEAASPFATVCDKTSHMESNLSPHLNAHHVYHQDPAVYSLPQLDGNDTLDSRMSGISQLDSSATTDLTYNYSVNTHNQTRRLLTSAQKPPMSVTSNNFEVVDNIPYAFNVNVECNSGVYMKAIKPVLEAVNTEWVLKVDNWSVTCSKVSNRQDNTGRHLLCTVLTLAMTDDDLQGASQSHKVTLHFYHTKDKIQVQSSGILSPGTGAASWLVRNVIEPLVSDHIAANRESI